MTNSGVQLLVSVRNACEAQTAIQGGADVVDVKDPARGSLGRADRATISGVVDQVAGRRPITAALGELGNTSRRSVPAGICLIKVGLAGAATDWRRRLAWHIRAHRPGRLVAVAYADHKRVGAPAVPEVLHWAARSGAAGMLIDTAVKDGQDLFDWLGEAQLRPMVAALHRTGRFIALAGSLKNSSFERAVCLRPRVVAVRGAACIGSDRNGSIDVNRVSALANLIAAHNAAADTGEG